MRLAAASQGSCCLPRAALQPANRLPLGRAAPAPLRFHSSSGSLLAGRRTAHGGSFRRRAAAVAPACALPEEAFSKVVDALKEVHTKPTDREVVAVGEAAAAAAASTVQHVAATSKTVVRGRRGRGVPETTTCRQPLRANSVHKTACQ